MQQAFIPGILMLGTICIFLLILNKIYQNQVGSHQSKSFECNSKVIVGGPFLRKSKEFNEALPAQFVALGAIPVLIAAVHLACSHYGRMVESWWRISFSVGVGLAFTGFYFYRLYYLMAQRRCNKVAYQQVCTAAQALDQLETDGYRVFHNFPTNCRHIDHVVIGPTGVMAVKTIVHPISRNSTPSHNSVAIYDGRMLHFPKFSDFESIDQVKGQAEWLSAWLTSTLAEEVGARAMVVVPGWTVQRKSAEGISVVNPSQVPKLFEFIKPLPMSPKLIGRIIQQLELHAVMRGHQN